MNNLTIRFTTRDDDAGIRRLLERTPMPGGVSLRTACEPSFFSAIEPQGYDPTAVVGETTYGEIIGVGVIARRLVFLNGTPAEIGYLGALRLAPEFRGTTALARGYRLFEHWHRQQRHLPFYLSTIMEDNQTARKLLTAGRAGLPVYREIGRYATMVIPAARRRSGKPAGGICIRRGSEVGAAAIAGFLSTYGPRRQFYPCYTAADIAAGTGPLRGLQLSDIYIAINADRLAGVLGCWNQHPFRQHIVAGYSGWIRWCRPAINLAAPLFRQPALPDPGENIDMRLAACLAVENDDPVIFQALLRQALADAAATGAALFAIGLAWNDPLLPAARKIAGRLITSRIYVVAWPDGIEATKKIDSRPPYLELGSL